MSELLEIMGSNINGYATPLKEDHIHAFKEAFAPLYYAVNVDDFEPQLAYCIEEYLSKDPALTSTLLMFSLNVGKIFTTDFIFKAC